MSWRDVMNMSFEMMVGLGCLAISVFGLWLAKGSLKKIADAFFPDSDKVKVGEILAAAIVAAAFALFAGFSFGIRIVENQALSNSGNFSTNVLWEGVTYRQAHSFELDGVTFTVVKEDEEDGEYDLVRADLPDKFVMSDGMPFPVQ